MLVVLCGTPFSDCLIESLLQDSRHIQCAGILYGVGIQLWNYTEAAKRSLAEEVDAYFALPAEPLHSMGQDGLVPFDPLVWWAAHEQQFPQVVALACNHLSLLPTSVPAERAFSIAGWLFDQRQCSLKDDTMSALLFLNCNAQHNH